MTTDWRTLAATHARSWSGQEYGDYPTKPGPGEACGTCVSYRAPSAIVREGYCKDELSPWPIAAVDPGWWCCFWERREQG